MCGDSGVDVPLSRVARWEASSGSIAYADLAGSYMASGKRRSSPWIHLLGSKGHGPPEWPKPTWCRATSILAISWVDACLLTPVMFVLPAAL